MEGAYQEDGKSASIWDTFSQKKAIFEMRPMEMSLVIFIINMLQILK
jgi:beta-glucosidase/6-phospho-beta-glucosidase/beta-galactosidase